MTTWPTEGRPPHPTWKAKVRQTCQRTALRVGPGRWAYAYAAHQAGADVS